ncbi:MAG: hypothetical protein ABLT11_02020 [Candidatus Acidiferrum sp.]
MSQTPNSRNYLARTLALALACCLVLFVVQVVVHGHEKGHNEAACRVCHAAHMGAAPIVNAFLVAAPVPSNDGVREIAVQFHKELFAHDAPSRAPPAV